VPALASPVYLERPQDNTVGEVAAVPRRFNCSAIMWRISVEGGEGLFHNEISRIVFPYETRRVYSDTVIVFSVLSLCLTKHHAMKTYWGVEV
jgi:hypothetical protein